VPNLTNFHGRNNANVKFVAQIDKQLFAVTVVGAEAWAGTTMITADTHIHTHKEVARQ